MNLEQQVCGLDLAKRLKELGVKQESYFAWCDCDVHGEYRIVDFHAADGERRISAFSAAELGEMLPQNRVRSIFYVGMWFVELFPPNSPLAPAEQRMVADTEANARAKMLIYLLESRPREPPPSETF
jgi:hypothetical protein